MTRITDGWDAPVGTAEERRSPDLWPGAWYAALNYGQWYLLSGKYPAIHTGADLILIPGGGYGEPLYAPANGVITFARDVTGTTWRKLIVIEHTEPDGTKTYTRFGHAKDMLVKVGDEVTRGQMIAHEGNAEGAFAAHLHYDISRKDILLSNPTNWPGDDIATVRKLYVDPYSWTKEHRNVEAADLTILKTAYVALKNQTDTALATMNDMIARLGGELPLGTVDATVTATPSLKVRATPSAADNTNVVDYLVTGTVIKVGKDTIVGGGRNWRKIGVWPFAGDYVVEDYLSF